MRAQRIKASVLAAYGGPALGVALVGLPLSIFLPPLYAGELGVPLGLVGLAIFLSRLTDVMTDPLIGLWSDRTAGRFGRRKPFILAGAPILAASIWLVLVPPDGAGPVYLFMGVFCVFAGMTLVDLPYRALGAEASADYAERTRLAGARESMAVTGVIMALVLSALAESEDGGVREAARAIALAGVVVIPVTIVFFLWRVPDPPIQKPRDRARLWPLMRQVARNKPFRRLAAAILLSTAAVSMISSMSVFFLQGVMELEDQYPLILLGYFVSSFIGIAVWVVIGNRIGKHRAFMICLAWLAVASLPFPFLRPGPWAAETVAVLVVLKGFVSGAFMTLAGAMAADVVDIDLAAHGEQRSGVYFAFAGVLYKGGLAVGVLIATTAAQAVGYDPSADANPAIAKLAVACLYSVIPAGLALLAAPVMRGFAISRAAHDDLQRKIGTPPRKEEASRPLGRADRAEEAAP